MSAELRVDWCDYKAAKYAVEHWHYSRRMPKSKQVYIGVWEEAQFIGCIIFGLSVTPHLGDAFDLSGQECAELTRIALKDHLYPVSLIATKAIKMLRRQSPGLRLLVSYADPFNGHHGGIYQAMNWVYIGGSSPVTQYFWRRQWRNDSPMLRYFRDNPQAKIGISTRTLPAKHKYLYPLDRAMRKQIAPLAKPYPKREAGGQSVEGDTSGDQPEEAGSIPAARSDFGYLG